MKEVCIVVSKAHRNAILDELLPSGFSAELRSIAGTFVELQSARHSADCDSTATLARSEATGLVEQTESAFRQWLRVRASDEATVFLAALLFGRRWAK